MVLYEKKKTQMVRATVIHNSFKQGATLEK